MAKYLYTSGKRKGKVYQEFYYTLNGQQIVNKKSFYCPVNTKWLSKEEFKQYILQLIENEYPNYLVVDELPEEPQDHIIYFLKQVNEDQSIYYDVYVYDNEELKQITFQGGDSGDLAYVKKVCDYITTKSLSTAYDSNLMANKNVITSPTGKLTTADIPHAFVHNANYQRSAGGFLSFYVYSYSSIELTGIQLGYYLEGLGCINGNNYYPVAGKPRQNSAWFQGMYATKTTSTTQPYRFWVRAMYSNTVVTDELTIYSDRIHYYIYPIF